MGFYQLSDYSCEERAEIRCGACSPDAVRGIVPGYRCTRATGHDGPHVAHGRNYIRALWEDNPEQPQIEPGQLLKVGDIAHGLAAEPWPAPEGEPPATLRDWFAGMAMQGLCSRDGFYEEADSNRRFAASAAYALADAMLRARRENS